MSQIAFIPHTSVESAVSTRLPFIVEVKAKSIVGDNGPAYVPCPTEGWAKHYAHSAARSHQAHEVVLWECKDGILTNATTYKVK